MSKCFKNEPKRGSTQWYTQKLHKYIGYGTNLVHGNWES